MMAMVDGSVIPITDVNVPGLILLGVLVVVVLGCAIWGYLR